MGNKPKLHANPWQSLPIKVKLSAYIALILMCIGALVYFTFAQTNITMQEAYAQENDYYNINSFMNTFIQSNTQLDQYLRDTADHVVNEADYRADWDLMQDQLDDLQMDVQKVGTERYLLANAMRNCYIPYLEHCNILFSLPMNDVEALYAEKEMIEKISGYMQLYTHQLLSEALSDGQTFLAERRVATKRMHDVLLAVTILFGFILVGLLYQMIRSVVDPVLRLATAAKDITHGNFDTPDVEVKNRDEVYELATAFNRMKRATKKTVTMLREKNEMEQQLHRSELAAMESQNLMEQAKMQQLRSQINPHFLFNTLNTISRTARKEKAPASEKLILSLAHLFRYGLKTDDREVTLQREINIVNDYLNIQTTRFENRIRLLWRIAPDIDPETVMVPAFVFQPIVENAIIHGLEPKLEGGQIRIRVHRRAQKLVIIISDNGVGMDADALQKLMQLQTVHGDVSGIGVGNVRSRLLLLHAKTQFTIHARLGRGTSVSIVIPT